MRPRSLMWVVWCLYLAAACGCRPTPRPQVIQAQDTITAERKGPQADPGYVAWLEERSMLHQARQQALQVSGNGVQWRHPYGAPQPEQVVKRASVWLLDYPGSVIPQPGRSVIETWGDPKLWETFQEVGIDLLHTGPVNRSGGIREREYTPTQDGWFDPVSLDIDPQLGTEEQYRRMVQVAGKHGGSIAGDLVPLHTGTGPDFRLALMAYKDYPGMYTMVEVAKDDWSLLPKVEDNWSEAPVPKESAEKLTMKGYIPGLINNNDAVKNARDLSGWSASGEILGADGKARRWVYLHYFKPGQPTLNWLDPSYAGPRVVAGDIVHQIQGRGARVLRLDAVPFTGIEPDPGKALSKHYQHPLSINATNELAFLTRKMGGWTFHELNVPLRQLKQFTANGPDLSYDFFTRAQCLHGVLTEDAAPLRLAYQMMLDEGLDPLSLVHDLQNHDEITYQLVELDHRKDEELNLAGRKVTGKQLRDQMLEEMRAKAAGKAAPHNKLYRPEKDGLATTFAGFVAAALGIDPYNATPEQVAQIKQGHLLLAHANAMQPGVFSLSSWDLVGALPVPEKAVEQWIGKGDYRWVNRGGVDLMGANPKATQSAYGVIKAKTLYGSLPEQMKDPESFVGQLKAMLAARKKYRLPEGKLLAIPEVKNKSLCALVIQLPDKKGLAVTVLNFGRDSVEESIDLGEPGKGLLGLPILDIGGGTEAGTVSDAGKVRVALKGLEGKTYVIQPKTK